MDSNELTRIIFGCECSMFECTVVYYMRAVICFENKSWSKRVYTVHCAVYSWNGSQHISQSHQHNVHDQRPEWTAAHCTDMDKNWYCNMFWVDLVYVGISVYHIWYVLDGQRSARVGAREPNGVKARSFFSQRTTFDDDNAPSSVEMDVNVFAISFSPSFVFVEKQMANTYLLSACKWIE